jgi:predicted AAA+ superfamily ATPase
MENILLDRNVAGDIVKALELRKITFLLGSRQTGKTSLMRITLEHFKKEGYSCFFLDMDDSRSLPVFESVESLETYLVSKKVRIKEDKIMIAVDEFYVSQGVIKIFKVLWDHYPNIRVMASGSSAVEAKANIEESLAGRLRIIEIFPLNFKEYLLFRREPYLDSLNTGPFQPNELMLGNLGPAVEDMMLYGGYPGVSLLTAPDDRIDEIYDIYSTYIQKDIRALLKDEDIITFNKMVKLLAAQSGQLLNISSLTRALGIGRKILERYLFILEKTYVISLIAPYSANVKKTVVKIPKLYFIDTGMMNMAIENFSALELRQNKGSIFETFVLAELMKYKKKYVNLFFYRTTSGTEIDFILKDIKRGLVPIEVKYREFQNPVVPKAMTEFCKSENVRTAYILNKNLFHEKKQNGTVFVFLPFIFLKKIFED